MVDSLNVAMIQNTCKQLFIIFTTTQQEIGSKLAIGECEKEKSDLRAVLNVTNILKVKEDNTCIQPKKESLL